MLQKSPKFPSKIHRMLDVLPAIAGLAQKLKVPSIVRSTRAQGQDVIDLYSMSIA